MQCVCYTSLLRTRREYTSCVLPSCVFRFLHVVRIVCVNEDHPQREQCALCLVSCFTENEDYVYLYASSMCHVL